MKKLVLMAFVLTLAAAPAWAYVQLGHLPSQQPTATNGNADQSGVGSSADMFRGKPRIGTTGDPKPQPLGDPVTRPVPEPGTLALTSLGLLALGAASRRRRGN